MAVVRWSRWQSIKFPNQELGHRFKLAKDKEKSRFSGKTVLIVDEDANMANILSTVLSELDVEWALTPPSMREASEILATGRVDCVVLDWLKGGGPGLEFVRFIRTSADSPDKELPIVLCTADTTIENVVFARDTGVSEIIAKPFSVAEVEAKLSAAMFRRRSFVRSEEFCGPDRRRSRRKWQGDDRRGKKRALLDQAEIDTLMGSLN